VPFGSAGTLYIDSGGGSAYVGLALASLIKLRGLRCTGIVAAECSSAALLPFAACEQRIVTPHSTLYFHPMRWQSEDEVRIEEAAEWTRHFKVLEEDLDGLLAKMLGIPLSLIQQWSHPGRFLNGREFAEAGLARVVDLFAGDWKHQTNGQKPSGPRVGGSGQGGGV